MGVKTIVWGRPLWHVAKTFARCIDRLPTGRLKSKLRRWFLGWLLLFAYVVPCVFCRHSFAYFAHTLPLEGWTGSLFALVYTLKGKVSRKLLWQDIRKSEWRKWIGYEPTLAEVQTVSPKEAQDLWVTFTYFMVSDVSDWTEDRQWAMHAFPVLTAKLMAALDWHHGERLLHVARRVGKWSPDLRTRYKQVAALDVVLCDESERCLTSKSRLELYRPYISGC